MTYLDPVICSKNRVRIGLATAVYDCPLCGNGQCKLERVTKMMLRQADMIRHSDRVVLEDGFEWNIETIQKKEGFIIIWVYIDSAKGDRIGKVIRATPDDFLEIVA